MELTLGPVPYYWTRERLDAFYDEVAETPVHRVYLGETVCSRRHEYRHDDWIRIAEALAGCGKEVVLSAQVLMESEADLRTLRRLAANGRFMIEANDMGAVHVLGGNAPFVAGPHLNLYSAEALHVIAGLGAVRWVPPFELSHASLGAILADKPAGMTTEVLAFGRLPLAFSARCFTARHYDLPKDDCRFRCLDHPDGLPLATRDGEPFLVLNGIQTQSFRMLNLIDVIPVMQSMGVDALRLSPTAQDMTDVIACFRRALAGELAVRVPLPTGTSACNGYWHARPGLELVMEQHD